MQKLKSYVLNPTNRRKVILWLVGIVVLGYVFVEVAQFVVLGFPDNPPVEYTVAWDSPRTEELWNRACRDCHSNETIWPWYSYVAPVSVLVIHDVMDGRDSFNVSYFEEITGAEEMAEEIEDGGMPPVQYIWNHPEADFTEAEKAELIAGLYATFPEDGD